MHLISFPFYYNFASYFVSNANNQPTIKVNECFKFVGPLATYTISTSEKNNKQVKHKIIYPNM